MTASLPTSRRYTHKESYFRGKSRNVADKCDTYYHWDNLYANVDENISGVNLLNKYKFKTY